MPRRAVLTSLWLEVALFFGKWYDVLFWVLNIISYIYKGTNLLYPDGTFAWELCLSVLYIFVDPLRILMGSKGNKTETAPPLLVHLVASVIILFFYLFIMFWQTYVLNLDFIIGSIGLAFVLIQVLLSAGVVVAVARTVA